MPGDPAFLELVFSTPEGEASLLTETDAGSFFVVRVDGATPPAPRPFEEVREQVLLNWQVEAAQGAAMERAEGLLDSLAEGRTLDGLAEAEDLTVETAERIDRLGTGAPAAGGRSLAEALFGIEAVGGAAVAESEESGAYLVRLTAIEEADPASQSGDLEALSESLTEGQRGDLLASFTNALRDEHGVTVNFEAINRAIEGY